MPLFPIIPLLHPINQGELLVCFLQLLKSKNLLPPINMSVAELARQENISEVTLYNWRKHAKDGGAPVPGDNKLTDE